MELSVDLIRGFIKYSVLISAIAGSLYYNKYKKTPIRIFVYLLWYIVFTEFFGDYMIENEFLIYIDEDGIKYNLWIVNLLYLLFFPIVYYIYWQIIKGNFYRNLIKIFTFIYVAASIINWIFLQSFITEWSKLPYVLGSIFLIVTIIFYLLELLRSEKILIFHKILMFWISVGLLLFHTGTLPFSLEINGYALIPGIHKLFLIIYILAILMYLIFTFGFIWSKKEQQ